MKLRSTHMAFLGSVVAHAALMISLSLLPPPTFENKKPITIDIVETQKTPNKELLSALQQLEKKMKLVEQSLLNKDLDKNAKFYSEHNQKVLKQTAAQNHGDFQNKVASSNRQKANNPTPGGKELGTQEKSVNKKLDLFGLRPAAERFGHFAKGGGQEADSNLPQTRDHLKGVDPGLQTLLSTREFVYFSYYNRIRNQLAQHWEPLIKDKFMEMYRKGRQPAAATEDRITKVIITLDEKGLLMKVQVVSESGIRDLDDAAVDAFRAAAPFPNPPKGIVDKDGTIQIRWDFIIEA